MSTKIERELPVELTEHEKDDEAHKASAKTLVLREIEQEKRDATGGFNKRIKDLKKEIKAHAEAAETGHRTEMVPCEERSNWPASTLVVRLDGRDKDGRPLPEGADPSIIEERPCAAEDVDGGKPPPKDPQLDMFNRPAEDGAPASPEGASDASNGASAEEPPGDEPDAEQAADGAPPADDAPPAPQTSGKVVRLKDRQRGARRLKLNPPGTGAPPQAS